MARNFSERLRQRRETIAEYVRSGNDKYEAAHHFKCSLDHVEKVCRLYRVTPPRNETLSQETLLKVLFLLINTDLPLPHIADQLRLTLPQVDHVYGLAKKAGFKINRPLGRPRKERLDRLAENSGDSSE